MKGVSYMKKMLISFLLALLITMSTTAAVFAVDDVGLSIGKDPVVVKPMVDDVGL